MTSYIGVIFTLLLSCAVQAAPLSAVITFDSMTISADGVTKQTQYQERFIRDNHIVWRERIIAASVPQHQSTENTHTHEHNLNFSSAGKWLIRDNDSNINFRLVRREDKTIIEPRNSEYDTLGFDGEWESAYFLLKPSVLSTMIILQKPAPKGSKWYEIKNTQQFTRILWNEQQKLPLIIENGTLDGTSHHKMTVTIAPNPSHFPWENLGNYKTVAYEDLLD